MAAAEVRRNRCVKATDTEWAALQKIAERNGMTRNSWLIEAGLESKKARQVAKVRRLTDQLLDEIAKLET